MTHFDKLLVVSGGYDDVSVFGLETLQNRGRESRPSERKERKRTPSLPLHPIYFKHAHTRVTCPRFLSLQAPATDPFDVCGDEAASCQLASLEALGYTALQTRANPATDARLSSVPPACSRRCRPQGEYQPRFR